MTFENTGLVLEELAQYGHRLSEEALRCLDGHAPAGKLLAAEHGGERHIDVLARAPRL
jgi:hypothetical protein